MHIYHSINTLKHLVTNEERGTAFSTITAVVGSVIIINIVISKKIVNIYATGMTWISVLLFHSFKNKDRIEKKYICISQNVKMISNTIQRRKEDI